MLDGIDEGVHQDAIPHSPTVETTMQKTALTIFGALLISGSAVQMAPASERHRSEAYFGRDLPNLRGAYNEMNGPIIVTPRALDRFDPSRPGGEDPTLNPSAS
jgi:hypothetical protein